MRERSRGACRTSLPNSRNSHVDCEHVTQTCGKHYKCVNARGSRAENHCQTRGIHKLTLNLLPTHRTGQRVRGPKGQKVKMSKRQKVKRSKRQKVKVKRQRTDPLTQLKNSCAFYSIVQANVNKHHESACINTWYHVTKTT